MSLRIKTVNVAVIMFVVHVLMCCRVFAGTFDVFVSIPPQKNLVEQIAGDNARVHVLVEAGQNPHTFEASPRQIEKLSGALLYFSIGLPFEEVLVEKVIATNRSIKHIQTDMGISKRSLETGHQNKNQNPRGTKLQQTSGHIEHEDRDPHIWLSPSLLKIQADTICDGLVAIDPEHATAYRSNLAHFIAEITETEHTLSQVLAPLKGRSLYVFHPAFGYFADAFGLKQVAIEIEGKSPTPKNISTVISRARADGVRVIFVQKQNDRRGAMAIAEALDGEVISLDPLAENVLENMIFMAEEIRKALTK